MATKTNHTVPEDVLRKIEKLMNLADETSNGTEHEMLAALGKAEKLMSKYNVTHSDVFKKQEPVQSRLNARFNIFGNWEKLLINAVAKLVGVEVILCAAGRHHYTLVGYAHDIKITEGLFWALNDSIRRRAQVHLEHVKSQRVYKGQSGRSITHAYLCGITASIHDRVDSIVSSTMQSCDEDYRALIHVKKDAVSAKFQELFPSVSMSNITPHISDVISYNTGRKDGESMDIGHRRKLR